MRKILPMHKFKLLSYQNSLYIICLFLFCSCQGIDNSSSVQMIRDLKRLPPEKLTELSYGHDTIFFENFQGKIHKKIFAKNKGIIPLQVSTVVVSCNCTQVSFDKRLVPPGDSLGIDMIIESKDKFAGAALTVVGNVPGGQKTVFIRAKYQ